MRLSRPGHFCCWRGNVMPRPRQGLFPLCERGFDALVKRLQAEGHVLDLAVHEEGWRRAHAARSRVVDVLAYPLQMPSMRHVRTEAARIQIKPLGIALQL